MRRLLPLVLLVLLVLLPALACSGDDDATPTAPTATALPPTARPPTVTVRALSTDPAFVTGGDVLVELALDPAAPVADDPAVLADLAVAVDGRDVTELLPVVTGPGGTTVRRGLVDGLPEGPSVVRATLDGTVVGELTVVNHPSTGPVFSGPHVEPLYCATAQLGLGPPLDEDCTAPTQVSWWYLGAEGAWHRLADGADPPADAVEAPGTGEPLVVRRELGTLNRAVYELVVPDPGPRDPATFDPSSWGGDLVYRFGGGCGTGRTQGSLVEVLDDDLLTRGYMVATSTFNTFDTACDDVLSAETLLLVREHVAERFGVPRWVVGQGDSGGSIQQYLIAQNYPGLLDAIHARLSYPDIVTTFQGVGDCGLLARFWTTDAGAGFTSEQRAAVQGHATVRTCLAWGQSYLDRFDPTTGCSPLVPAEAVYDPDRRPDGIRCTPLDAAPARYGVDPATGAAVGPFDNTGVQYGLEALRAGVVDAEAFVALNEGVGGYDLDGRRQDARTRAPADVVARMYAEGRVLWGGGGLADVPVIDVNLYTDDLLDIHDRVRLFSIADRMAAAGVPAGTRVIWTVPGDAAIGYLLGQGFRGFPTAGETVDLLVAWLEAAAADDGPGTRAEVLARTRPAAVADDCLVGDEHLTGDPATGAVHTAGGPCATAYPVHGDPRIAAGAARANDVLACRLVPIDPDAYGVPLTPGQLDRLRVVFPDGVCDWSAPGTGQAPPEGVWQRW